MTEAGRHFLVIAQQMLHMRSHAKNVTVRRRGDWPPSLGVFSVCPPRTDRRSPRKVIKRSFPEEACKPQAIAPLTLCKCWRTDDWKPQLLRFRLAVLTLFEQRICEDRLLICLRKDDPLAKLESIPKMAVSERLQVMFHRDYHPLFYDRLMTRLLRAGIRINPTETYSALSEMQYIVNARGCLGLIREHAPLDPQLITRPIGGLSLKAITALVCHVDHQRPAIPVLAYRMAQRCLGREATAQLPKKAVQSVKPSRAIFSIYRALTAGRHPFRLHQSR